METKPSFLYMVKCRLRGKNFLYEACFKGKKTLDVGCGNGEFLRYDPDSIEGVDLNPKVIKQLSEEGLKVKLGSVETLPFGDKSFSRVHCRNVIEHLSPDLAYKMLRESARVLDSGGILVLGTEMATNKIWGTFGHTKPYPPGAIKKLLREKTGEEFETLNELDYIDTLFLGHYSKYKALYLISSFLAYYFPYFAREYFIFLRKR